MIIEFDNKYREKFYCYSDIVDSKMIHNKISNDIYYHMGIFDCYIFIFIREPFKRLMKDRLIL